MKVLFLFFNHPATPFNTSVAALSGVVRDAGHERASLSVLIGEPLEGPAERVRAAEADVIAVSAMTRDWPHAQALLEMIGPGPRCVVGGYHASLVPREVAGCDRVDAVCIGDGERPLRAILDGFPETSIPGLWVRGPDGFPEILPPPDPEPDIAALPAWDYDVFGGVPEILDFGVNTFGPLVDRYLPTRAGRGCPFRCAYCTAPVWGEVTGVTKSRNVRPVEHLCDELAALRDAYAPDGFEFWDEHFPVDPSWLESFAELYPKRVGLPFKVEMHPNAATRARLTLLRHAGCRLFHCGVEAGDSALRRDTLNRRTSDTVLERVFADARELGIETSASVMTAVPGETYAQARKTVALLRHLSPDSFMWSTFMTLPRTVLGEQLIDHEGPVSAMSEAERHLIHAELSALQKELVGRASTGRPKSRTRRVAVPSPPIELPIDQAAADPVFDGALARAVAERLSLGLPEAATSSRLSVERAEWSGGELLVLVGAAEVAPHVISIAPADGQPAFRTNAALRFSHRGSTAAPEVLSLLRRLSEELDAADFMALQSD